MILVAFVSMSLAWSFSWFAMKLQASSFLPVELSVFYRFAITAVLMFILCAVSRQRMMLRHSEWKFLAAIGLCNFCLNFLLGYWAVKYIPSGVIAVIFSLSIIISEIISSFVDKRKIERKVVVSSSVGFVGLTTFVLPLISLNKDAHLLQTVFGLCISLAMVTVFSCGNVLVAKNKIKNYTPLYTSIAYGSAFGSLYTLSFNLIRGNKFAFDFSTGYVLSLAYLIVIASIIAFIALFYLIHGIGSARANYTALVYPAIALITSSFLENYHFSSLSVFGFLLIISALLIDFIPKKRGASINQNHQK
jgi:drug/metabolite transporter (DMT)-like permease